MFRQGYQLVTGAKGAFRRGRADDWLRKELAPQPEAGHRGSGFGDGRLGEVFTRDFRDYVVGEGREPEIGREWSIRRGGKWKREDTNTWGWFILGY